MDPSGQTLRTSQTESSFHVNGPPPPRATFQLSWRQPHATTQGGVAGRPPCPSGGSTEDVPTTKATYSEKQQQYQWNRKPKQEEQCYLPQGMRLLKGRRDPKPVPAAGRGPTVHLTPGLPRFQRPPARSC